VNAIVTPVRRLRGHLTVPGDKSISHRAALLGALAQGRTEVTGFLEGEDCLHTLRALESLGIETTRKGHGHYLIHGAGLEGFQEPQNVLDCGNSGTSARLLLGLLAGQPFSAVLTGDESLRRRPMDRVVDPLRQMGATVIGRQGGRRLPLAMTGRRPLRAIHHRLPVASAQVKSALLLASLFAEREVTVEEPALSRDHTERMLRVFGAAISREGLSVSLEPGQPLFGQTLRVPGDFSSAAFFLILALIVPDSDVVIDSVGLNPTRTGLLELVKEMGGQASSVVLEDEGEPWGEIRLQSSALRGVSVGGEMIPKLIDEFPILAVAAACADGITDARDARELRVKESDRIRALVEELGKLGVRIEERDDGFTVYGRSRLRGSKVSSWGDHRIAMALIVAGLVAEGQTMVEDIECIQTSFPGFFEGLTRLAGEPCVKVER
jgi:3-phosphoshikimate 1-carboxyvinyltransferase